MMKFEMMTTQEEVPSETMDSNHFSRHEGFFNKDSLSDLSTNGYADLT